MLIDFSKLEEQIIPHMRGGEKEFAVKSYTDGKCKTMYGRLIPGASIGLHTHETNCEVIYVMEGSGKVLDKGEYISISAGQAQYCPKGDDHALVNDGDVDLVYFAAIIEQ